MDRRGFLAGVGAMVVGGRALAAEEQKLRAAIIGHTGKGDYGHGLDVIFNGRPEIEVVAIADPHEAGRAKAAQRCGAKRQYARWEEMLETEKPHLVSIAPRQTTFRRPMLLGALAAGAHVICEKPLVQTPADGDEVLALAARKGLKIAVPHQMRLAPAVVHLKKRMEEGLLGDLLEMRAWGKQDRRSGGEDLVVLGVHLFDLMRLFAGDPAWCTARVLEKGRDATLADAKAAGEDLGPVLGDEIDAQFAFAGGVLGTFTSRARMNGYSGYWGIELIGSKGAARILADIWPRVLVMRAGRWENVGRADEWKQMADDPAARATPAERGVGPANERVVNDWLAAIRENREPVCSGANGAKAVEMVMAIWRAGLSGGRVKLPLVERGHVLAVGR